LATTSSSKDSKELFVDTDNMQDIGHH